MNLSLERKTCAPSESVLLTGQLRPGNKAGEFSHQVAIVEKTAPPKAHILLVAGTYKSCFRVSPSAVTLTPDPIAAKEARASVDIRNESDQVLLLQKPVRLPEGIEANVSRSELKPGDSIQLIVSVKPLSLLESSVDLAVPTSHPAENPLTIKANISPIDSIALSPETLSLGVVGKRALLESYPFKLNLSGPGLSKVKIGQIRTPSYLRVQQKESRGADSVDLRFAFEDHFAGMNLNGEIIIDLQVNEPKGIPPRKFTVRVPISGILTES
jgi:hypothetical protein